MMKSLFTKTTIVLALMYSTYSCTYTSTKTKPANFKVESAKISENLKTLVTFEKVEVNGIETTSKDQVKSSLEIRIINGSNLPTDDVQLKSLAKSIASQFKQELSNVNDFNIFNVVFVTIQGNAIVSTNSSKGISFKSEEL